MSEPKKPSAAAMRAAEKLLGQRPVLHPAWMNEVASIIDAEFAPVVEALMKLTGAVDGLFVGYTYLTKCKEQAINALAALESK